MITEIRHSSLNHIKGVIEREYPGKHAEYECWHLEEGNSDKIYVYVNVFEAGLDDIILGFYGRNGNNPVKVNFNGDYAKRNKKKADTIKKGYEHDEVADQYMNTPKTMGDHIDQQVKEWKANPAKYGYELCSDCDSTGYDGATACETCNGTGLLIAEAAAK